MYEVNHDLPEEKAAVSEFEKYGHAILDLSIEKFLADGYELGDTVDIVFSNGYEMKNIPFFDGYYVTKGEPPLRAYPGFEFLAVCISYGKIQESAGLSLGDSVTISLNTKGGALDTQVSNSMKYTTNREDYESDIVFANFREVTAGSIAPGRLFRSCSLSAAFSARSRSRSWLSPDPYLPPPARLSRSFDQLIHIKQIDPHRQKKKCNT